MKKSLIVMVACFVFAGTAFAQADKQVSKINFADFDGVRVHYETVGKGSRALIFIHGWACSEDFWRKSINEFPAYRVIAIDLPGHGKSDKPRTDYTMEYFARSIAAVMRDARVKQSVLVGHSMGTPVIRQFYRLYPKETLGLVIVDGPLRADPMKKEQVEKSFSPAESDYKDNMRLVDGLLLSIRDEQLKQEIRSTMLATPEYVGSNIFEGLAVSGERIWADDKVNVPVLAIMSEAMNWRDDTEKFYRYIAPDLEYQLWKDVSHFLMMERPDAFNEAIRLFVSRNGFFSRVPSSAYVRSGALKPRSPGRRSERRWSKISCPE